MIAFAAALLECNVITNIALLLSMFSDPDRGIDPERGEGQRFNRVEPGFNRRDRPGLYIK